MTVNGMKTLIHITITFVIFGIYNLLGSATLQNGLIGHWKFDETSGTTAYDSSGNEYNAILYGTSNGSVSWVDGKVNGAIDLDGSNDYLAIQTLKYNQAGQIPAISISVWLKTSKSTEAYIVSFDRSENWRLSLGGMNDNKKVFFASSNNGGGTSDKYGATILNDNNWHHVVVTYDKVTSKKIFYLDGSVDATHTVHASRPLGKGVLTRYGTIGTTNEDDTFNHSSTTREDYFNGLLDDLRIYDRAISLSEAGILYSLGNRYGDPDGDGLYNFEEEILSTNPLLADSDGDGLSDSVEVQKTTSIERVSRTGEFTFDEAVLDAESRGGYLATITNSDENNDVDEIATSNEWLGGTDKEVEGVWEWITGEEWTYSNWNPNEPNNSNNEDGLHIYSNGKWNDIPLTNDYAYILEKPVFTEISDPLNPDSDGNGYSDLLDKGLLAWYLFENNSYDMSGNNRHGTLSGSPTFSNAIQGKALSLDGLDDFIDIAHDSSLDPRREISISMWLKIASLNKTWTPVFYKGPGDGGHRSYGLWLNSSQYFHPVSADSVGQEDADSNSNSWTTNQWYHSVMVMNRNAGAGFLKFYLNGVLLSEASARTNDTASSSNSLRIGGTQETNSEYQTFHGSIDNLRIYDYAISQDLVSKIYEIESNASISIVNISDHLPAGLHAYYKLDGNAEEETDNGYDGSLTGTDNDPTGSSDRFNRPNRAFYFDGNDRLKLDHRALDDLSAFSISMWAKIETFEKMPLLLSAAKSGSLHNQCFFFYPTGAGYKIYFQEHASYETLDLENSVGLSNWKNLTLTRGSGASSTNFYIDGSLAKTFTFSTSTAPVDVATGGLWLGADQDSVGGGWENQQHFKGWLDEIRFYNRALNASEVNTIFEVTRLISSDFTDVDDTAPVITLNGNPNITHEAGLLYVDANASWTDGVDGSGTLVATGEVNVSIPGTYTLSYNFTDAAGNVAQTVTRTVNVVDRIAPVITLNGDANITHEAGFVYVDANASWMDAVDGSGVLLAAGEVNVSIPGTYTLSYNFTDAAGNVAQTVTRTVKVVDTIAPVIMLSGHANITHEAGFVYVDANASWTDEVDGSGVLVATGGVNASVPGIYELSYHYTDEAGNEADTVIRKVHVINLTPYDLGFFSDSNLSVYENEPVGTWIADFDGVDMNPDSMLTYHLMGVWDANLTQDANLSVESTDVTIEDFFDLDVDGSLTTERSLDYEKDPIFFEILVRVTDQHGAYYEKPFFVSVLNEVEDLDEDGVEDHYDLDDDGDGQTDELEIRLGLDPRDRFDHAHAGMVFTLDFEYLENDDYRLRGELLTDGKASPIEYGFILTSTDQNSTLYTVAANETGRVGEEFTKVVGDLDRGKSYVYQAYVINELGMGVGQMKWIRKIVEAKLPEIFNEAEELDGGWYTSWMGEFWMGEERKWFYHLSLGWVFQSEDGKGGVWIWWEPDGWMWTTPDVWPFLWSQDTANWTYLIENLSIPRLYDYSIRDLR